MPRSQGPWLAIGTALTAGLVVLGPASLVSVRYDVPIEELTYDTTSLLLAPPYVGSMSMLNLMLCSAAAGMAALVSWMIPAERGRMALFAALMALLGVDDALRLHEGVGPQAGIPEELFYVVYGIAGLWLARAFWPWRAGGPGWAYYLGAALLAGSILVDQVAEHIVLLEDSSKLLGTFVWLTVPVLAVAAHSYATDEGVTNRPPVAVTASYLA